MSRTKALLTVLLSVTVLALPGAGGAHAASKPADKADDVTFTFVATVASVPSSAVSSSMAKTSSASRSAALAVAASSCKTITGTVVARTTIGDAYHYGAESTWCYTGATITYRYTHGIIACCAAFWSFEGNVEITSNASGYPWHAYRQGHFCHNFPTPLGFYCATNHFPWVDQTMRATGAYSQDWGNS